jgi:hypothetical protein
LLRNALKTRSEEASDWGNAATAERASAELALLSANQAGERAEEDLDKWRASQAANREAESRRAQAAEAAEKRAQLLKPDAKSPQLLKEAAPARLDAPHGPSDGYEADQPESDTCAREHLCLQLNQTGSPHSLSDSQPTTFGRFVFSSTDGSHSQGDLGPVSHQDTGAETLSFEGDEGASQPASMKHARRMTVLWNAVYQTEAVLKDKTQAAAAMAAEAMAAEGEVAALHQQGKTEVSANPNETLNQTNPNETLTKP